MELRQLRALLAVVETGSVARAAGQLGYTQSAVSQQIAALERSVGCPLFDRPGGPRPVRPTAAGAALVPHARAVLARVDAATDELDRIRAGSAGRLVLGTFQSVSNRLLPELVRRVREQLPALDLRVVETNSPDELVSHLHSGVTDLSFLTGLEADPSLDWVELCLDPFVVVGPADGTAVGAFSVPSVDPIPVGALHGAPFVGETELFPGQALIDRQLAERGAVPQYVFRSDDNGTLQALVRAGLGWAVMPFLAVDDGDPGVWVADLDPPLPPRHILLARHRGRTLVPAAETVTRLALEVSDRLRRTEPSTEPRTPGTSRTGAGILRS